MDIAVIGDSTFVLGFQIAGIKQTYECTKEDYLNTIQKVMDNQNIGILILNNVDLQMLSESVQKRLRDSVRPVVIAIGHIGESDLREKIKKAIGLDLYAQK